MGRRSSAAASLVQDNDISTRLRSASNRSNPTLRTATRTSSRRSSGVGSSREDPHVLSSDEDRTTTLKPPTHHRPEIPKSNSDKITRVLPPRTPERSRSAPERNASTNASNLQRSGSIVCIDSDSDTDGASSECTEGLLNPLPVVSSSMKVSRTRSPRTPDRTQNPPREVETDPQNVKGKGQKVSEKERGPKSPSSAPKIKLSRPLHDYKDGDRGHRRNASTSCNTTAKSRIDDTRTGRPNRAYHQATQDQEETGDISEIMQESHSPSKSDTETPTKTTYRNSAKVIHETLRSIAVKTLTNDEKEGCVYIIRCAHPGHQHENLVKIGFTTCFSTRFKTHEKCGLIIEPIKIAYLIPHVRRAEKLIKADLGHVCRPLKCPKCSKTHNEWFDINEQEAREVVARWNEDPEHDDHHARWKHWDAALSKPEESDHVAFQEYQERMNPRTQLEPRVNKIDVPIRQPSLGGSFTSSASSAIGAIVASAGPGNVNVNVNVNTLKQDALRHNDMAQGLTGFDTSI
ncbi:T5orf172 domain-containing protein [Phaeosphaeriaceae sp. PMI808]|nr:T5orf172 domain-containing protein [Phaeosphaeriaceae sp. PMI808]